ncbi:MAG: hypothetical protein ABI823_06560 [Bryobacteraceae bacterium]
MPRDYERAMVARHLQTHRQLAGDDDALRMVLGWKNAAMPEYRRI